MKRRLAIAGCCLSVSIGLGLYGEQGYLALKAQVAAQRIATAYRAYLVDGRAHAPWRWADTHPLGRLSVARLGIERTILAGASGSSLAFGPGHIDGTATPNTAGTCAIAGHRDSWFGFLGDLREGDVLWLETRGARVPYRVSSRTVHSMWDSEVLRPAYGTRRLVLVTCWPLDGLFAGPDRLVVVAEALGAASGIPYP